MEQLELWVRDYFEKKRVLKGSSRVKEEPEAEQFYRYVSGLSTEAERDSMAIFLAQNVWAQEFVLEAQAFAAGMKGEKNPPSSVLRRVKKMKLPAGKSANCPHCGKSITPFHKPLKRQTWTNRLWLLSAAAAFTSSFVLHRYYMQFLILTGLLGVKWIMECRATKTQIMIYRALQEETPPQRMTKVPSGEDR